MPSFDQIWHRKALSKCVLSRHRWNIWKFNVCINYVVFFFALLLQNRFWRGMYGRFESGVHPRESMNDLLLASQDHTNSLEDHVQHLTKRIANFKNLISNSAKRLHNASKLKTSARSNDSNDNKYVWRGHQSIIYHYFFMISIAQIDSITIRK